MRRVTKIRRGVTLHSRLWGLAREVLAAQRPADHRGGDALGHRPYGAQQFTNPEPGSGNLAHR
jgi:hypothetical protein